MITGHRERTQLQTFPKLFSPKAWTNAQPLLAIEIEQLGFGFFPLNQSPLFFQIEKKT